MSLLNQLFSRGVFGTKCKTSLNLAISRIKLLQNKRDMQLKHMRKEIAQFLQAGQEAIARIRVEHVIREQNMWAAYEILELFCEFVLARVPIIESQRECPSELREAIASIIFAAPRCSDLPDLLQIKNLFTAKYGKEFVMAASELRPDSGVNRTIIEKLSVLAPAAQIKLKVLKDIAQEYNLAWDSSSTEAEFSKTHEDLLAGSKQIPVGAALSQAPNKQGSFMSSPSNGTHSIKHMESKQESQHLHAPSASSNATFLGTNEIEPSIKNYDVGPISDAKRESRPQSTDILEKARAAIASAEHASAAARAAAALVNVEFRSLKVEEGKSS
ncbi:IST1 homolog [Quercus lobata]|uniref:IST1 homolog n=1 Tax=Quercus lobata TaxID=97700 RepID=UPI00124767D0|nr:IST1 homolog [Quercus lobata]